MKFFDDSSKKNIRWWNRNYFFAGTIIVILVNILLFAFAGNNWESIIRPVENGSHWGDVLYFIPTLRVFLNAFSHSNWQHVLLNMLCFFFAGFYLERKTGSFGLLLLIIFGAFISGLAITTNDLSIYYHGFSGVNYLLYGFIIVEYCFSFQKYRKNKTNIIWGAITIALIYLAMCFSGGTNGFGFEWYPYDMMHNLAHYSSLVAGIIVATAFEIVKLKNRKETELIKNE